MRTAPRPWPLAVLALISSLFASHALAGPIEKTLRRAEGNVPTPIFRPRPSPQDTQPPTITETPPPPATIEPTKASACLTQLSQIALAAPASGPKEEDSKCRIPDPVSVKATLGRFPVEFSRELTLDCPFALAFARFVRDTVQPLARHHLDQPLASIGTGPGYTCRRRNNAPSGKLSEHAFGNAIDMVTFRPANGAVLNVTSPSQMQQDQARFFSALRTAACGSFTTVLGPGSNPAHATHLHLDLGRSKDRKNPYRICE